MEETVEVINPTLPFGAPDCRKTAVLHRLAYVLGEIFEMPGPEAAETLDISPDLFRKRLQHARTAILTFTRNHCGLVSDAAACSCNQQVSAALRAGKVRADACNDACDC